VLRSYTSNEGKFQLYLQYSCTPIVSILRQDVEWDLTLQLR